MDNDEILAILRKSYKFLNEKHFYKKFPEKYKEINELNFPNDFTFAQKLYHYFNNDLKCELGICAYCGNRSKLKSFWRGYGKYCCNKCTMLSEETKEKRKNISLNKYGTEYFTQSNKIKEKTKNTNLEKYGVKYYLQSEDKKIKEKQTNLKKYGVEYSSQSEIVKEKKKQTCILHFGVSSPFKSNVIKSKSKQTCISKYSVPFPTQSDIIKNKTKQTCLKKYGVEFVSQSNVIKEKKKQTCLKKYGVEHYLQTEDKKIKEKQTNLEKYGVEYAAQSEIVKNKIKKTHLEKRGVTCSFQDNAVKEKIIQTKIKKYGMVYPSTSKFEKEILSYINEIYNGDIIANDYIALNGKEIDIYLPELKLGFEFNGDFWHMNPEKYSECDYNSVTHLTAKESWERDEIKRDIAESKNIVLVTIWESEWKSDKDKVKKTILECIKKYIKL